MDLNALLAAPWQARMLQFVGGLGPRKAPHLLKAVQKSGSAESRYALWRELQAISNCILRSFFCSEPFCSLSHIFDPEEACLLQIC